MRGATRWTKLAVVAAAAIGAAAYVAEGRTDSRPAAGSGRPPIAVDVTTVQRMELARTIDVVGSLAPKFAADVKSEVAGIVTNVYVTEWLAVKKGTPLARLDTSEIDASIDAMKAAAAQAGVAEARARREYERALQLKQYGLITPQVVDDARSAVEAAEAATAAARAQVRAAEARRQKCVLVAPMNGVVALRAVNVGDRVENIGGSGPLFRIVDNSVLDLTASVPSVGLEGVRVGEPLEFTVDALPGRTLSGTVMFINPAVDEASRAIKVVAEVRNGDGTLKGGMFVKGRIVAGRSAAALQVPRSALVDWNVDDGTACVFVMRGGTVEKRAVKTGDATGANVAIASGLAAGEQVVTRGGFALQSGDQVKVAGQGV